MPGPRAQYVNIIEERRGFGVVALILAFSFGILAAQTYAHFALQCYRVVIVEEEQEPTVETFLTAAPGALGRYNDCIAPCNPEE